MFDVSSIDAYVVSYLISLLGVGAESILFPVIRITLLVVLGLILYFGIKRTFVTLVRNIIIKKNWNFGSYLIKHKLFTNALKIIPVAIILHASEFIGNPILSSIVYLIAELAMILIMAKLVISILDAFIDISDHRRSKAKLPIKTLIQFFRVVLFIACALSIVAKLTGKDVSTFLSGMMGLSALFMVLFRDALLGIVAGFQISINGIMQKGDWIEIPSLKINGEVVSISLTTITIANWNNTKTILPAHKVLSETVINWEDMVDSGRRIKESILIDKDSVRFLTNKEIEKFKSITVLKDYIESKEKEINDNNSLIDQNELSIINGRNLTNIGTFRAYAKAYLLNHKDIANNQTLLVRKRPTEGTGIPIEIYAFSSNTKWGDYEEISSSIFEHLYSVMEVFGLSMFQNPTGNFNKIGKNDSDN